MDVFTQGLNDAMNDAVELIPKDGLVSTGTEYVASQIDSESEWDGQDEGEWIAKITETRY
jgi:hypothetical protein